MVQVERYFSVPWVMMAPEHDEAAMAATAPEVSGPTDAPRGAPWHRGARSSGATALALPDAGAARAGAAVGGRG